MTDHDDRLIPLPYEPAATPSERSFWTTFLDLFRIRRNVRDERVAKAMLESQAEREADARRTLRQPGVSPEAVEKALRVLGRVGRGGSL